MRRKLTDKAVANVEPPKRGRLEVADTLEPGLTLRVTEKDARSWVVRVWTGPAHARRQRRVLLGHPREIDGAPALTLAQARAAARDVKQAAAEGKALAPGDGVKGAQTWHDLSEAYITAVEGKLRPKTVGEIKRRLRRCDFAEWRNRPAIKITSDDVRTLRDTVAKRGPIEARHYVNLVNAIGAWAIEEKLLPASPAAGVKPGPRAAERERVLSDAEIAAFLRGCDRLDYPFREISRMLLLSAARLREVAHAEWSEFNLDFRVWLKPGIRTKNGRPHAQHLSRPAAADLRACVEQRAKIEMLRDSPFVFTTNGRKFTLFSSLKDKIDAAMAEELGETPEPWTLHDLRRTAATTMARLKAPAAAVEKILNHAKGEALGGAIAKIYNRFDYADDCAEALDKLGEFVTALAEPKVVPFKRSP
jgi:integrase